MNAGDIARRYREDILRIAHEHGARNVHVFGSVVRGEDREGSDVDLLVDPDPGFTLLDLAALVRALEERLGCPVDVVIRRALRPRVRDNVLREARPL